MALIFEDSEKVTKKQIYIPQNAKKVFKAMGKIYKPYIDKNLDGSKIMKSLSSETQYNKKGDTSNKNGQKKHDSVSVEDAKVRLHRQEKLNPNSVEYQLYGGQLAHDILKKGIEGARGVIINITGGANLGLHEVNTAAEIVQRSADPEANIIFGAVIDESIDEDIIITVIATGFDTETKPTIGNIPGLNGIQSNNSNATVKPWEQKASSIPSKNEPLNSNDLDIPSFLRKKSGNK